MKMIIQEWKDYINIIKRMSTREKIFWFTSMTFIIGMWLYMATMLVLRMRQDQIDNGWPIVNLDIPQWAQLIVFYGMVLVINTLVGFFLWIFTHPNN